MMMPSLCLEGPSHNCSKAYFERIKAINGTANMLENTLHDQLRVFSLALITLLIKLLIDINDNFHV